MSLKKCNKCNIEKNIKNFGITKVRKWKYPRSTCKSCEKLYRKKYYKINKKKEVNRNRQWIKNNPWAKHYSLAKQRCNNIHNDSYKYYGAKGIKFLLTMREIKKIWLRDKAYTLLQPSIDRINSDGNYEFDNCRFIEMPNNSKRARKKEF